MKTCKKCLQPKALACFYSCKGNNDGLHGACKACMGATNKQWRVENKDAVRKYKRENHERILQRDREWVAKNIEKVREVARAWCAANPEKINQYHSARRDTLGRSYVIRIIAGRNSGLKANQIPRELIEVKREHLRLVRLLRELK